MRPMTLCRPRCIEDAVAALQAGGDGVVAYAGGLEVLFALRAGTLSAHALVDTKHIEGATGVCRDGGEIRVGPATRHHHIATDPIVRAELPLLAAACASLGTTRIRMQGTIGGNLAAGLAPTDPGTAALVHTAVVELVGPSGRRRVPIGNWYEQSRVDRCPDELVESIRLTPLGPEWATVHDRVEWLHRPPAAIVSVAARVEDGRIVECRIAAGGVPTRLSAVESALVGRTHKEVAAAVTAAAVPDRLLAGLVTRAVSRLDGLAPGRPR